MWIKCETHQGVFFLTFQFSNIRMRKIASHREEYAGRKRRGINLASIFARDLGDLRHAADKKSFQTNGRRRKNSLSPPREVYRFPALQLTALP